MIMISDWMCFVRWKRGFGDSYWYVFLRLHMCPPAKGIIRIRFRATDASGNEVGWAGIITDRSLIKLVRIAFPHRFYCRSLTCLVLSLSPRAVELKRCQTQDAAPLVWKLSHISENLHTPSDRLHACMCVYACVCGQMSSFDSSTSIECVCIHSLLCREPIRHH